MKRFISQLFVLVSLVFVVASCLKAPFLTLNTPRSFTFTNKGGSQSITFTCNRDWSVSSSESWIQVSPSSGTASDGEVTVKITCAENTTYDARTATVTVKVEELSEVISISQDTGLGLLVSPTTFDLTNAAQTIEIEVQKNVEYSFSIDPDAREWITHTGTKGLTSEKLTFSIEANETYDDREGVIAFKQSGGPLFESVVIKQSQKDGLFVEQDEYLVSAEEQIVDIKVKTNIDYTVSVDEDSKSWIEIIQTKGLTDYTISARIAYNDGVERVGVLYIRGDKEATITIKQDKKERPTAPEGAVDLGLSVFWGKCNIGADNPEDYGDFYAWGETETKGIYSWGTYKLCNGDAFSFTKYNSYQNCGTVDYKIGLDQKDDVAFVKLGGRWYIPTDAEWTELRDNCTWTWTTLNNVYGMSVISQINGNSIFLPAAGYHNDDYYGNAGSYGYYWSSSRTEASRAAWHICFSSDGEKRYSVDRYYGISVRPISEIK